MTDATPTPPKPAPKAALKPLTAQEAVDALIAALETPRANIAEITITAKGRVRVATRDRAMLVAASLRPLDEEPSNG